MMFRVGDAVCLLVERREQISDGRAHQKH